MTQILRVTRDLPKSTLQLERRTGHDGQGDPTYASAIDFEANVVLYDTSAQQGRGIEFVMMQDGTRVRTPLTLYVQGDEANVPNEEDRVSWDGATYLVTQKITVAGLFYTAAQPDHHRLHCAKE